MTAFCNIRRSAIASIGTAWGYQHKADPTQVGECLSDVYCPIEARLALDHEPGRRPLGGLCSIQVLAIPTTVGKCTSNVHGSTETRSSPYCLGGPSASEGNLPDIELRQPDPCRGVHIR